MPKKNVKKPISPDTKLEVPIEPFQPDEQPVKASGPSSGSKGGVRPRRDPQPEEESEVKREQKVEVKVKVEEKKEPPPKGTLSLALQRIHGKLQSPTELLKLHFEALSHVN